MRTLETPLLGAQNPDLTLQWGLGCITEFYALQFPHLLNGDNDTQWDYTGLKVVYCSLFYLCDLGQVPGPPWPLCACLEKGVIHTGLPLVWVGGGDSQIWAKVTVLILFKKN